MKGPGKIYEMRRWNRELPYFIFLGLSIIIIISFSFLTLIMTIRYNIGPFKMSELVKGFFVRTEAEEPPDVAIYEPTGNRDFISRNYGFDPNETALWFRFLKDGNIEFSLLGDEELDRGDFEGIRALIIPQGVFLSKRSKRNIRTFAARGGGVISSALVGVMERSGRLADRFFMKELFGLTLSSRKVAEPYVNICPLPGRPLSTSIPPGMKIECSGDHIVTGTARRPYHALYQSGYGRGEFLTSMGTPLAAMNLRDFRKGRTVWFGFSMSGVKMGDGNYNALLTMVMNAVNWVRRYPLIGTGNWPEDKKGCIALGILLEPGEVPAGLLLERLNDLSIRPTFFLSPPLEDDYRDRVRVLRRYGEVALRVRGSDPSWKKGEGGGKRWLEDMGGMMTSLTGSSGIGISIHEEGEDNLLPLIEDPLFDGPYNYLLYGGGRFRKNPSYHEWFFKGERRRLFIFPSPDIDALALITRLHLSSPEDFYRFVEKRLTTGEMVSSLVQLNIHNSILAGDTGYFSAFEDLIEKGVERGFWISSYREIHKWLTQKENISISIKELKPNRVFASLINQNEEKIYNLSVKLFMPRPVQGINFISEQLGAETPKILGIVDDTVSIKIPSIKEMRAVEYTVDYK